LHCPNIIFVINFATYCQKPLRDGGFVYGQRDYFPRVAPKTLTIASSSTSKALGVFPKQRNKNLVPWNVARYTFRESFGQNYRQHHNGRLLDSGALLEGALLK